MPDRDFWNGRRVFLTGHTGFKGSWLLTWLHRLGAEVSGYALDPDTDPNLFGQLFPDPDQRLQIADIRDADALREAVQRARPEVVFHLAAQPLVLESYRDPGATWATNVQGTVNLLEALRPIDSKVSVVIVTTDKVYENREWEHAYREDDRLGGLDPYSASKAACELVVQSYRATLFPGSGVRVATARAGNVIGGGDWAANRIVPDLARALSSGQALSVRNPEAIRPWQHVLDPLSGYLRLAEALWQDDHAPASINFGPATDGSRTVRDVVETALRTWPGHWRAEPDPAARHEATRLELAINRARDALGWTPTWGFDDAVARTMEWYRVAHESGDLHLITQEQIAAFEGGIR